MMGTRWFARLCLVIGCTAWQAPAQGAPASPAMAQKASPMPLDVPMRVNNIETACTGLGETKLDPRWLSYPLRVEFFDAKSRYIPGDDVSLFDGQGNKLASVTCDGLWLLFKVAPGDYVVEATEEGARPRTLRVRTKAGGQIRAQLIFPDIFNSVEAAPGGNSPRPANDSADVLNRQIKAQNRTQDARYRADQEKFRAEMKTYESEKREAAAANAAYARQLADWQSRVKACKNGNLRMCAN